MGENVGCKFAVEGGIFNWEKDGDGHKSVMEALKAQVKQLDPKALPVFLGQVSKAKEIDSISWEFMISLYEVVARVHGVKVVPHMDKIMKSVITALDANVVSSPLQQACSKVVVAIARHGIEPSTPEDDKRRVIHSLCKPLSDSLLGSRESLTSGAALCLEALVHSDNWQFVADEMVNRVCQNVVVALGDKSTQSDPHMGLVMSLAEHNPSIVEAYARLLIQSGLQILRRGITEENSHKRRSAIQMIHILIKCLDPRSVHSELDLISEVMERLQSDAVQFVSGAALEAWETARKIAAEEQTKLEKDSCSVTGSNFRQRRGGRSTSNRSSRSVSPESHVVDEYSVQVESSILSRPVSPGSNSDGRSINRKLWRFENGGVDISLKDGLFSGSGNGENLSYTHIEDSPNQVFDNGMCNYVDEFQGFGNGSSMNEEEGVIFVPTLQDSPGKEDSGNIGSFRDTQTPINAVKVRSPGKMNEKSPQGQLQRFKSMPTCRNKLNFTEDSSSNISVNVHEIVKANTTSNGGVKLYNGMTGVQTEDEVVKKDRSRTGMDNSKASLGMVMVCVVFFIVLALGVSLQRINLSVEVDHFVPT